MTKLQQSYCKQILFWNKKYFKLGFTYMLKLNISKDEINPILKIDPNKEQWIKKQISKEIYSFKVHNFLQNLRQNSVNEEQKIVLYNFINRLCSKTEKQKKRFLMYYNLIPNSNKLLNYSDIAKIVVLVLLGFLLLVLFRT